MTGRLMSKVAALALAALLLAGAGTALAGWPVFGNGSGSGTTDDTVLVTLTPGSPVAALYPGASSSVKLVVANPNLATVAIGSLLLDSARGTGGFSVDAGHVGCAVSSLSYTTQTNGGAGWTIPAKVGAVNGSLPITLAGALSMSASAANACQGATFTVYLVAGR